VSSALRYARTASVNPRPAQPLVCGKAIPVVLTVERRPAAMPNSIGGCSISSQRNALSGVTLHAHADAFISTVNDQLTAHLDV